MAGAVSLFVLLIVHVVHASDFNLLLFNEGSCRTDGVFDILEEVSLLQCASLCLHRSLCSSVNYFPTHRRCILRDSANVSTESGVSYRQVCFLVSVDDILTTLSSGNLTTIQLQDGQGFEADLETMTKEYYEFPQFASSPCFKRPCDQNSNCVSTDGMNFTCVTFYCADTPSKKNAVLLSNSAIRVGDKNMFSCVTGFTEFYSNPQIMCQADGHWSHSGMVCFPNCPPVPVKDGTRFVSSSTYRYSMNTTVRFECEPYFYNLYKPEIRCQDDGTWTDFTCTPNCRQAGIPILPHGSPKPGTIYTIHDKAEYVCAPNYYFTKGSHFISCFETGTWSQPEVECLPLCGAPLNIANGNSETFRSVHYEDIKSPVGTFTIYDSAYYFCNTGYVLTGSTVEVCQRNGVWTVVDAECYPPCPNPQGVRNGVVSPASDQPYIYGNVAYVSCNGGFYIHPEGASTKITCQDTGVWTNPSVSCYRYCGHPQDVSQYTVLTGSYSNENKVGTKAYYECNCLGMCHFSPTDNNAKTCNPDGNWDGLVNCCFGLHEWDVNTNTCVL